MQNKKFLILCYVFREEGKQFPYQLTAVAAAAAAADRRWLWKQKKDGLQNLIRLITGFGGGDHLIHSKS